MMMRFIILLPTIAVVTAFQGSSSHRRHHHCHAPTVSWLTAATTANSDATPTSPRTKRIAQLLSWAAASNIPLAKGVAVTADANGGLGLARSGGAAGSELLVTVPASLALSVPGSSADVLRNVLADQREFSTTAPWFAQFSVLLHFLKTQSPVLQGGTSVQPWLDSLPRSFATPLHWTASQRRELQYPHLQDAIQRQDADWKHLHQTLQRMLTGGLTLSYDDFVWGCECARSRAFSGYSGNAFNPNVYAFTLFLVTVYVGAGLGTLEQAANGAGVVMCASIFNDFIIPKLFQKGERRRVIVPLIDMVNHDSKAPNAQVSFEFFANAYSLASSSSTSSGELYISYGARSNDQLLQYYGFVEADNPHDVYVMPPLRDWNIERLEQSCGFAVAPGVLEKLDRAGLLGSDGSSAAGSGGTSNPRGGVVVSRNAGLDPAVLQALRALVATPAEWMAAGEAIGNFAGAGSESREARALLVARTQLQLELDSKATTLEQDLDLYKKSRSRMGGGALMDVEEQLALQFRIEKKKLLQEIIDSL